MKELNLVVVVVVGEIVLAETDVEDVVDLVVDVGVQAG